MVRFLPLWHRRGIGLSGRVFLTGHAAAGQLDRVLQHVRGRLSCPTHWRHHLRSLWRSGRSQGSTGHRTRHDGRRHYPDRLPADLQYDRRRCAIAAGDPAIYSGSRGRWPMGRRDVARHGKRARQQTWFLRCVRPGRRTGGIDPCESGVPDRERKCLSGSFHELGMAHTVYLQRRSHRTEPLRPVAARRHPGIS